MYTMCGAVDLMVEAGESSNGAEPEIYHSGWYSKDFALQGSVCDLGCDFKVNLLLLNQQGSSLLVNASFNLVIVTLRMCYQLKKQVA